MRGKRMNYRMLGRTGLMVSEIGLGGEWLERHNAEEVPVSLSEHYRGLNADALLG